jgi:hypothetical protein
VVPVVDGDKNMYEVEETNVFGTNAVPEFSLADPTDWLLAVLINKPPFASIPKNT